MESFVAWGQAYGLYVTIVLLIGMYIIQSIENSRLKKSLEALRADNSLLNKGLHRAYIRGGVENPNDGESK